MNLLLNFLQNQADTEKMRERAHSADRPCALLTPIVPIRFDEADSWFGGKPRLPKGISWPEQKGVPLHFACQINLSQLPAGIWSGAGPRDGWLAVFVHPVGNAAEVLHIRGDIEERDGPGQMGAEWARTYASHAKETDLLPRWPVRIDEGRHARSIDTVSRRPSEAAWKDVKPDLANPALHPFDPKTLVVLLDSLEEFFIGQLKQICRFPAMKKLRENDLQWMDETKALAFQSLEEFYKVEAILVSSRYRFDLKEVAAQLSKIAGLPTYEFNYLKDDEDGYCCLEYRSSRLCELPDISRSLPIWWSWYTSLLYWHGINAYTKDPASLHPALRELMERIWLGETLGHHGAMGHAPAGHLYTPHGPETDTEVLLELPTSSMQGWIWGDVYSIVLLIKRKALSQGNFADIAIDITN
ncbi:DUF1963 domain-containing protein [Bradyrhizobium sp. JYMT SZCCT0180]|uniref:DUF1963 domain-containing protein n=1 Tax=Bradyrhizobium sp. JYMT SZCCT0180 TaxID=2807666 RepID=UPI001BA85FA5|nr:DUF1963 domain-containing protein [Bradyrhizobium sp. JYMT SZCCT0180]MBR1210156.1 DUF1963 domain-containing protein [Bradyrhizobium sp. JYMT SZCCT0180]